MAHVAARTACTTSAHSPRRSVRRNGDPLVATSLADGRAASLSNYMLVVLSLLLASHGAYRGCKPWIPDIASQRERIPYLRPLTRSNGQLNPTQVNPRSSLAPFSPRLHFGRPLICLARYCLSLSRAINCRPYSSYVVQQLHFRGPARFKNGLEKPRGSRHRRQTLPRKVRAGMH